ncbi:hypothetical protein CONLIGDRAFT_60078 [Coniochaeta ligniaria NRRL 30616]|uniref:Casein kinase II beta 2 subunit n=1 Tax=Coniochaeta ligniaria NRRL 30616 TaxID=1408157 RepID=A0A1J7K189_9PEZI|nr:hypothetical protein CONLIGDRAFT_60078 [Coniochaeta ligniaria NRRL 30616]
MSPAGGIWAPAALRLLRQTALTTTKMLRQKIAAATRPLNAELQPITVRASGYTRAQPIHPSAILRQQKRFSAKWFSTHATSTLPSAVRRFLSTTTPTKFDRTALPVSTISRAVSQLPGRAPFASTLRPNLTAGAFPRTAGGYSATGAGRLGGARYFSHTPAAPAQVVQNVSQAVRAFWLSGQRARYDGVGSDGRSRYRAVSAAAEETRVKMSGIPKAAPGAYVDFRISPTVTALSPLGAAMAVEGVFGPTAAAAGFKDAGASLNAEGFLDVLSTDFARALRDLAAVMADLKKLSSGLGDLPIELQGKGDVLRVRFPGVDADTVESLCDDVGVLRGVVGEDVDFYQSAGVPVALKFPFAPDLEVDTKTLTSPGGSMRSHTSALSEEEDEGFLEEYEDNPWLLSSEDEVEEGYESLSPPVYDSSGEHCSEDFEGLEGIYRFLEECDRVRNPF